MTIPGLRALRHELSHRTPESVVIPAGLVEAFCSPLRMNACLNSALCALRPALCALILVSCATKPPQAVAPDWEVIPAGLVEAFCSRLRMDAIATGGGLAIVRTTQPIASAQAYAGLGRSVGNKVQTPPQPNRTMPIDLGGGSCGWTPIDAMNARRDRDVMVVELSSPVPNPFVPGAAGVFARVSLGGEHPSWYWIALVPRGGGWTIGAVTTFDAR